jgi:hypothetical protein
MFFLSVWVVAQEAEPLPLELVPPPPTEMADLVQAADVRFEFGPEDSPKRITDNSPMAAETSYKIAFEYQSKLNWKVVGNQVVVWVRIKDIDWNPSHVVWFRRAPDSERFWDNPLVRHEFDHVRISTDPRLEAAFRKRVDELKIIRFPKSELGQRSLEQASKDTLREELTSIFKDISALAEIRYRELDRVTRHGREPLPSDADQTVWNYNSP